MKKIVVSIVLVCYLAVSSGVIINFHYCMNRLASTELFASEVNNAENVECTPMSPMAVARDEVQIVKMDDDQKMLPWLFHLILLALMHRYQTAIRVYYYFFL